MNIVWINCESNAFLGKMTENIAVIGKICLLKVLYVLYHKCKFLNTFPFMNIFYEETQAFLELKLMSFAPSTYSYILLYKMYSWRNSSFPWVEINASFAKYLFIHFALQNVFMKKLKLCLSFFTLYHKIWILHIYLQFDLLKW